MAEREQRIIEFYGTGCHYCHVMEPLVNRLEAETGIHVTKLEVWHDRDNKRELGLYAFEISKACGGGIGVPAFYNEKTGEALCGAVPYETLKRWALGPDINKESEPESRLETG